MNHLVVLIRSTAHELLAQRILWAIATIGIFIITGTAFFAHAMIGSTIKVLLDSALLSYQVCCYCIIIFYAIPLMSTQANKAIFTLFITHGVSRASILIGKWITLCVTHCAVGCIYYGATLYFFYQLTDCWLIHLAPAFLAMAIEACFLTSAALFWAILLPPALSAGATIATYIISYSNQTWYQLITRYGTPSWLQTFCYYLLPNLAWLDIKTHVVYQIPIATEPFIYAGAYSILYSILLLYLSCLLINKKRIV